MPRNYKRKTAEQVSASRSRARNAVLGGMSADQRKEMMAGVWPHSSKNKPSDKPATTMSARMRELRTNG